MERLPESRVQLEIAAEEDESAKAMQRAVRRVANQVTIPGFRKGKAPRVMIERAYGPDVFREEAAEILMTDLYRQALEQEDLAPVGDPEVDVQSTDPLVFTVIVPVYPDIDPGQYRDVRVEPIDATIEDAAVDELVESLRKSNSPWVDPAGEGLQVGAGLELTPKTRHPHEGDQVTIDYTVQAEGEPAEEPVVDAVFVLGESGMLEPVEDAIKGLRVGDSTGFSVPFAEDDETIDESVRGKTLSYTVTLKGLKERDLLPLDDDFARTAGDVDSLDELRRDIRDELHRTRTVYARSELLAQAVAQMAEGATIEIPEPMIDRAVENELQRLRGRLMQQGVPLEAYLRATEQSEDDLRAEIRPEAEGRLRNSLLLRAIAEKEAIEVSDEELDAAVERMSAAAQESERPQQAEQFARSDYVRDMLQSEYFDRRLTDRLIEIVTEGRGAVVNGWEPPAAEADAESETASDAANGAEPEAEASSQAATSASSSATAAETTGAGATDDEEA
jgi:trigger factor